MQNEWQPIETAPQDGSDVLLWRPNVYGHAMPIVAAWVDINENGWVSYDQPTRMIDGEPTHWMPLPAPPSS